MVQCAWYLHIDVRLCMFVTCYSVLTGLPVSKTSQRVPNWRPNSDQAYSVFCSGKQRGIEVSERVEADRIEVAISPGE